jgi:hypothetical protein
MAELALGEMPEVTSTPIQIGGRSRGFRSACVVDVNVVQIQVTVESDLPTQDFFPRIREIMASVPDADVTAVMYEV